MYLSPVPAVELEKYRETESPMDSRRLRATFEVGGGSVAIFQADRVEVRGSRER